MALQSQSLIANLLLVGIDKNQQHVRAVAVQLQTQQDYAGVADHNDRVAVQPGGHYNQRNGGTTVRCRHRRHLMHLHHPTVHCSMHSHRSLSHQDGHQQNVEAAATFLNEALGPNRIQIDMMEA